MKKFSFVKNHLINLFILSCAITQIVKAQQLQTLSILPDSPRWELQGQAKVTEYLGRKSIYLNGGAAIVKDFEMRDGVIDVDVATPANRAAHPSRRAT